MAEIPRTQATAEGFVSIVGKSKENVQPKLNRAVAGKRSALGNVTNNIRRQPQRVAKGKNPLVPQSSRGQENEEPQLGKGKAPSFAIFEDKTAPVPRAPLQIVHSHEPMQGQENISRHDLPFHDALLNLNQLRSARNMSLPPFELELCAQPSPMNVDEVSRDHVVSKVRSDEFGLDPYFQDIYNYLVATECVSRPNRDYMNQQSDVTTSMRNILVDWLVEVGEEYKLQRETLFLAISYVDRFLSLVGISRPKLQLVGTTCMFIASKYEEIYPPDVAEFVYITDDTYTRSQVLKMESVVLKVLDFKVATPTINWFTERLLDVLKMNDKAKHLAFFLVELSLIEIEKFLDFRPSIIAASAVVIARCIIEMNDPWPKEMEQITGYSLQELKPCIVQLFSQYTRKEEMPQKAVHEKYKQQKFDQVSLIKPPLVLAIF